MKNVEDNIQVQSLEVCVTLFSLIVQLDIVLVLKSYITFMF